MPNPSVLLNTIPLLEAQASSEIENIVTTTDALFKASQITGRDPDPAIKETLRYREALRSGSENMKSRALTTVTAIEVCSKIKGISMEVRTQSATKKILAIKDLQQDFRYEYRGVTHGMSNIDFLNVLFAQPYCRISNVTESCNVSRQTATKWLDALVSAEALLAGSGIVRQEGDIIDE